MITDRITISAADNALIVSRINNITLPTTDERVITGVIITQTARNGRSITTYRVAIRCRTIPSATADDRTGARSGIAASTAN